MAFSPIDYANSRSLVPKKKPVVVATVAKPKPVGAVDPYGASNAIADYIGGLAPDYSAITPPDYAALRTQADTDAQSRVDAQVAPYQQARTDLAGQKQLSLDASTNFTSALSGILTGGLEGQAGRDYALKTFGGSFLGEIQVMQGTKLFVDITHDFGEQDFKLLAKIADITATKPEIADQIYNDVVGQELENMKLGLSAADSNFDHRIKAASVMLGQARYTEKADATSEAGRLSALTKVLVAKQKAASQGIVTSQLTRADGSKALINKATGAVLTELSPPRATKPPKTPTVKTYRDPSTGVTYKINPDGTYVPTGKAGAGTPAATKTTTAKTVASVRGQAIKLGRSLFTQKARPTVANAFSSLMNSYGQALVDAGVSRKRAAEIIAASLTAASGGVWRIDPNAMGPAAPDAAVATGGGYSWGN